MHLAMMMICPKLQRIELYLLYLMIILRTYFKHLWSAQHGSHLVAALFHYVIYTRIFRTLSYRIYTSKYKSTFETRFADIWTGSDELVTRTHRSQNKRTLFIGGPIYSTLLILKHYRPDISEWFLYCNQSGLYVIEFFDLFFSETFDYL